MTLAQSPAPPRNPNVFPQLQEAFWNSQFLQEGREGGREERKEGKTIMCRLRGFCSLLPHARQFRANRESFLFSPSTALHQGNPILLPLRHKRVLRGLCPRKDLLWAFPAVLNERPRNHPHTRRLLGDRARPSKALCRAVREAPGLTTAEGEFCKAAAPSHWGCSSSARVFADDARGWQCPSVLCLHPQGCLRRGVRGLRVRPR